MIDAINRVFAEFELVYHNQFTKAFPDFEKLQYAKKIWYNHLQHLSAEQILAAAHKAIRESEYLPTIRGLLKFCDYEFDLYGLPSTRSAYLEACMAKPPQDQAQWSHPAVYWAGRETGWFFLANNAEKVSFPFFERNYHIFCQKVRNGETLEVPTIQALPEPEAKPPLSDEEQLAHLAKLRESLNM